MLFQKLIIPSPSILGKEEFDVVFAVGGIFAGRIMETISQIVHICIFLYSHIYTKQTNCHTRLHLGFSTKLRI